MYFCTVMKISRFLANYLELRIGGKNRLKSYETALQFFSKNYAKCNYLHFLLFGCFYKQ